jgi:protein SCO1/2
MKNITHYIHTSIRMLMVPLAILAAITLGGCQPGTTEQAQTPEAHPLTGVVVSVDKSKGLITVKHDAVPGKMEAMTMPFSPANPAALSQVHKGDKISADFSVQANGAVLDNIKVLDGKSK